jgi:hypothetical protein
MKKFLNYILYLQLFCASAQGNTIHELSNISYADPARVYAIDSKGELYKEIIVNKAQEKPFNKESIDSSKVGVSVNGIFRNYVLTNRESDLSIEVPSKLGTKVNGFWNQQWTNNVSTSLFGNITNFSFEDVLDRTFDKNDQNLFEMGFRVSYRVNQSRVFTANLSFGQEIYLRSPTTEDFFTERLARIILGGAWEESLIEKKNLSLASNIWINYLGKSKNDSIKVENGFNYGAGILLEQELTKNTIRGELFYQTSSQATNLSEQDVQEVGMGFSVLWPLGGQSEK